MVRGTACQIPGEPGEVATEQAQRGSLVLRGTGNMPDLLSRLCGGDLGMSRKSKAFLMCCVLQGCETSSLPVLSLERALCQWQGWTGGGGELEGNCGACVELLRVSTVP